MASPNVFTRRVDFEAATDALVDQIDELRDQIAMLNHIVVGIIEDVYDEPEPVEAEPESDEPANADFEADVLAAEAVNELPEPEFEDGHGRPWKPTEAVTQKLEMDELGATDA